MVIIGHGNMILDSAAADTPKAPRWKNLMPELASAFYYHPQQDVPEAGALVTESDRLILSTLWLLSMQPR